MRTAYRYSPDLLEPADLLPPIVRSPTRRWKTGFILPPVLPERNASGARWISETPPLSDTAASAKDPQPWMSTHDLVFGGFIYGRELEMEVMVGEAQRSRRCLSWSVVEEQQCIEPGRPGDSPSHQCGNCSGAVFDRSTSPPRRRTEVIVGALLHSINEIDPSPLKPAVLIVGRQVSVPVPL
ncbi:hypothetical protein HPP92_029016 [Vanilla planifolia]|uniref:Uncharacterized protein n=1 Tax=Vanilla planifolia TaxID=51239 RepID=A0A835U2M4_VANPL|nr:hypothetical protein HPP92_029004 [Vanilla planifolia]KAG0446084.1 hypothetical protein HPP92_029016 [Vanilla planifolia]